MRSTAGDRAKDNRDAGSDDNPAEKAAKEFETSVVGEHFSLIPASRRHAV